MSMTSIGLTQSSLIQIISAYAASNQQLAAQPASPAWYVVGAFYMPVSKAARLQVVGSVSVNGNLLRVRLYDVTEIAVVSGSTTPDIDAMIDERVLGGVIELEGGHVYQMQAECIGASGYGLVRSADLVGT